MKHYRVMGTMREDGSRVDETVVALSEQHAIDKAEATGVSVDRVVLTHADPDDGPPPSGYVYEAPGAGRLFNPAEVNLVRVPMLISAICNVVFGLFWAITLIGIPIAIALWILCVFEFQTWARLDGSRPPATLKRRVVTVAIIQIIVGLVNWITLVCGILALVGSGRLDQLVRVR